MTTSIIQQIEAVLDKAVRPALYEHNGNVILVDYSDEILRVRLTGRCSGCPSAAATTEELIAANIKEALPQIKDVILVTGVSDDLIKQAKALMNHKLNQ